MIGISNVKGFIEGPERFYAFFDNFSLEKNIFDFDCPVSYSVSNYGKV